MKTVGITHVGKVRETNEDTILLACENKPRFMLVADGMGGHAAGEVASTTAAQCIEEYIENLHTEMLTSQQVEDSVQHANRCLLDKMEENSKLQGMGTTLTMVYKQDNELIIAQVGDSSAYLYNDNGIQKLTKDHTYVQHLIDSGIIKQSEEGDYPFKNIITRALGMKKLEVDIYQISWQEGDLLLLCTDGLTTYANQSKLESVLANNGSLEQKAQRFIDFALDAGGRDNISVIITENSSRGDA